MRNSCLPVGLILSIHEHGGPFWATRSAFGGGSKPFRAEAVSHGQVRGGPLFYMLGGLEVNTSKILKPGGSWGVLWHRPEDENLRASELEKSYPFNVGKERNLNS